MKIVPAEVIRNIKNVVENRRINLTKKMKDDIIKLYNHWAEDICGNQYCDSICIYLKPCTILLSEQYKFKVEKPSVRSNIMIKRYEYLSRDTKKIAFQLFSQLYLQKLIEDGR